MYNFLLSSLLIKYCKFINSDIMSKVSIIRNNDLKTRNECNLEQLNALKQVILAKILK